MTRIVRYKDGDDWVYGIDRDETRHPLAKLTGAQFAPLPSQWESELPVEPDLFTVATFEWGGPDYAGGMGAAIRNNSGWVCAGKSDDVLTWSEFYKNVKPGTLRDHDGAVLA